MINLDTYWDMRRVLSRGERRRALLVGILMILNAIVQTAGVASILPFLAVLGNPEMAQSNLMLRWGYETFGFDSVYRYLLILGLASLAVVVGSAILRTVTEYALLRFVEMRRHALSCRLLRGYLRQPYKFFLNRNSSDLAKTILSEVDSVSRKVLSPLLSIPAYGLVVLGLIGLLVAVDPVVAGVAAAVVGGVYLVIYLGISRLVRKWGVDRVVANRERFTMASEAFGGIKDIKLLGREEAYLDRFRGPSRRYSRHHAVVKTIAAVPRYLIEAIGFGGILGLAVFLLATGDDLGRALPVLGLYAFAGYKLLPAAQHVYSNFTTLRFGLPAVEELLRDLDEVGGTPAPHASGGPGMGLDREIRWSDVTFRYEGTDEPALNYISLSIPARSTVAFVGETGAGKTTAVDLILGLLHPTEGEIRVDGVLLSGRDLRRWQNSIGYVPQQIYLADDTVAANIAFGAPKGDIDRAAVEQAARLARLDRFIVDQLADGYDTLVGERGVRLSGGQRQRLGIARALYRDPPVLVLDEATSALDTVTEQEVMREVDSLDEDRTVILIAHRLTTVKAADRIFLLDRGRLVDTGTFDELVERSAQFRAMAVGVAS